MQYVISLLARLLAYIYKLSLLCYDYVIMFLLQSRSPNYINLYVLLVSTLLINLLLTPKYVFCEGMSWLNLAVGDIVKEVHSNPEEYPYLHNQFFPEADGNSWSDDHPSSTGSSSTSRSESPNSGEDAASDTGSSASEILTPSPSLIFHTYTMYIQHAETPEQVVSRSMSFMGDIFPEQLLAKSIDELKNDQSLINRFLTEITDTVIAEQHPLGDLDKQETEKMYLIHFRAAVSTYNAATLREIPLDHPVILKSYMQIVGM